MKSPAIKLNSTEMTRMRRLPVICRALYIFSLRARMDYRNGYVGIKYRITYDRIRDDLDAAPLPGEQSERPSKGQVARALQRLERAGLIQRKPKGRRLIVHLPYADFDENQDLASLLAITNKGMAERPTGRSTGRSSNPVRPIQSDGENKTEKQGHTGSHPTGPIQGTAPGRSIGRSPDPEDPELDPEHTHARACARDGKGVASYEAAKGVCVQGETEEEEAIIRIWEHWKSVMDAQDAVLDPKRRYCIQRALGWGYTPVQLCEAITGCSQSPFHMGNSSKGQVFNGLSTILRDAEQIDRMRSSKTSPGASGERIRHGFPESVLEAHARPGEEYEHVAARLRAQRDNEVRTTQEGK